MIRLAIVAMASLIMTGCVSTPEEPSIVHRTDAEAKEVPGEGFVLRAGESTVRADGSATVRGEAKTAQREAIVPSDPAAKAKIQAHRAAAEAEEQAKTDALAAELHTKRVEWAQKPEAQPFLRWYCALTPGTNQYGEEILVASGKYGIVPKRNPSADATAERLGYAVIDCAAIASSGATE